MQATPDSTFAQMYGTLFNALADQHEAIEHAAHALFAEAIDRGVDPADMQADGSLLQVGLAQIPDGIEWLDGLPPVEYIDSHQLREKERVKAALLGAVDDDDDYDE